jgi:hypothetical protein
MNIAKLFLKGDKWETNDAPGFGEALVGVVRGCGVNERFF